MKVPYLNSNYNALGNESRYFVLTGGRGSGKSFAATVFLVLLTYERGHKILFTRYTMTSAGSSIIPEFIEKLEMMEVIEDFRITKDEITNIKTGSSIIFKGIKTASGNQTAALKSLNGVTTFVLDEAEELIDEDVFDKIDQSVRVKTKPNRVILILNPTTKEHWIYQRFYQNQGIMGMYNGIKAIVKSGAALGPEEFNEGSLKRHVVFSDYAYAPGDVDGYYTDNNKSAAELENYGEARRDKKAKAMAFHRNYHPAILFFNSRSNSGKYHTGGVFDPTRVMNAAIYSLGYRYENMETGNIEIKAISGRLLEVAPNDIVDYYNASSFDERPMGFYGADLGYELDFKYNYHYQREVDLGLGIAAALPGKAWQASKTQTPRTGFGLQGSFAIKF